MMLIENRVRQYLAGKDIPGIGGRVYMETPEDISQEYVIVEKTGSSETDQIRSATLAIQSYGNSLKRAAQINEAVKTCMRHMPDTEPVYSAKLNSDYNYTNPTTRQHRYQAVFVVRY